ncbi:MAG: surface glycoprotein, partial [Halobacteriaceae archaeon]
MTADERYTKTRAVLLAALMVVSVAGGSIAFAGTAAAATITVDDDAGSGDYSSIQTALDNAATGDTITVAAGTYQPFTVSTADVTVQSATGAMPVVDGSGSSTVVTIDADGVTLAGFEIVGDSATKDGVAITGDRAGITVKNNVIHGMAKADAGSGGIDGATYAIHNWGGALDGVVVRNNEIYEVGTTGYNDGDGTS